LQVNEELFLKNLYKIIDKEIVITPEIANTDVHKEKKQNTAVLSLLLTAIAVIAIFFVLFKGCGR
jgi:hypothetical protein